MSRKQAKQKKEKIRIFDRNTENDIRYRGPLSYRHLQIMGWLCVSFLVLNRLIDFGIMLDPNQPGWVLSLNGVAEFLSQFVLPLFLFANFAILLDEKKPFKVQLIKFGALSLLVVLLFLLATEHYALELGTALIGDKAGMQGMINTFFLNQMHSGNLSFNLFIDMFLCTLLLFFLEYTPKHFFTGKKRYIFRAFALLPVLYEAASLAIRVLTYYDMIDPPLIVYPLLTIKPPLSFVLFLTLVLFIKIRELRFRRRGKTKEEYRQFTKTNVNSWHFSVYASIMILITGIIDIVLFAFSAALDMVLKVGSDMEVTPEFTESMIETSAKGVSGWGIGLHFPMIFIIPVILLFSYTRRHKNEKADLVVPVGGVILAFFVGLEGLHQGILMNIPILMKMLEDMLGTYLLQ